MIAAWVALAIVLVLLCAAPFSAHIPVLRDWTGAAPLDREPPDDQPGSTLRAALGKPEYLDDLSISHDHRTD